jgi:hypothetical protein
VSRAEKRELNQHVYRRHGGRSLAAEGGSLLNRLALHEEMHQKEICDHMHPDLNTPTLLVELNGKPEVDA